MSIENILNCGSVKWMESQEGQDDIVISSRIRLARNVVDLPFPMRLDQKSGDECMQRVKAVCQEEMPAALNTVEYTSLAQLSILDRGILAEKHLISPGHAESDSPFGAILLNRDGSLATMVNEEDHLRIQCLLPGLQLAAGYEMAQQMDDFLESKLEYAFDERNGYLTSCPTNVGTGLRASVMLHLPAMQMTGQTGQILQTIGQLGMTVRGLYGEGTQATGNYFQMSNQITMGQSEEEICNHLQAVTEQIVEQEHLLRERLKIDLKYQLEDKIGRALGILNHARIINSTEALALLSDLRLGIDLGIVSGIQLNALNQLIVSIRPAHLQKCFAQELDPLQRDIKRAEIIQDKIKGIK
ncbi:MAG TPA: protein arginine kinase [Syntrophomonas sp.]|nr:protein arginine kinase [Syntrophomonas sp.]HRW11691.1 protein arginine kinase [Syntrophomonas sp.]